MQFASDELPLAFGKVSSGCEQSVGVHKTGPLQGLGHIIEKKHNCCRQPSPSAAVVASGGHESAGQEASCCLHMLSRPLLRRTKALRMLRQPSSCRLSAVLRPPLMPQGKCSQAVQG